MSQKLATFSAVRAAHLRSAVVAIAGAFILISSQAGAFEGLGNHKRVNVFDPQTQADSRLNAFALTKSLVAKAKTQVNSMYRFGGTSPETGFDCSGFINWIFSGITRKPLPRQSDMLYNLPGKAIAQDDLQAGDLMFYRTMGKRVSHVTMYIGDRQFIHATRAGKPLRVESMDSAYWVRRYAGAKRILGTDLARADLAASDILVPGAGIDTLAHADKSSKALEKAPQSAL
jgi:hypothetical protein